MAQQISEARRGSNAQFARVRPRRPTQREVLLAVLSQASRQAGGWMTLEELARATRFGEASISAQLRHLRKPGCGQFVVEKRHRETDGMERPEQAGILWEYRLRRAGRKAIEQG